MTAAWCLLAGIARQIEQMLGSAAQLGAAMAAARAAARADRRELRRADLAALRPLIADMLRRHRGWAAGAGVVLAPDRLADAPRWIEWWWADEGAGSGQLEVDLDPESAEFYDYTTTEWYRAPARTSRPAVAGPYVDYICTRTYTFTLSVPVLDAGAFLGVAGADVLAHRVEQMALPGLARLGREAVLVSGNGRVIASTTARLLPGVVFAPAGDAGLERVTVAGPLPWVLCTRPG